MECTNNHEMCHHCGQCKTCTDNRLTAMTEERDRLNGALSDVQTALTICKKDYAVATKLAVRAEKACAEKDRLILSQHEQLKLAQGRTAKQHRRAEKAESLLSLAEAALKVRNRQLGVACMEHDLTHALGCGICLSNAVEEIANQGAIAGKYKEALVKCKNIIGWMRMGKSAPTDDELAHAHEIATKTLQGAP